MFTRDPGLSHWQETAKRVYVLERSGSNITIE